MSYIEEYDQAEYEESAASRLIEYHVTCALCQAKEFGCQEWLEGIGWQLTREGEVCGLCVKGCVEFRLKYRRDTQSMIERVNRKPDTSTHFSTMVGMGGQFDLTPIAIPKLVSGCCGVPDRTIADDLSYSDLGQCYECGQHTTYITEKESEAAA